MHSLVLFSLMTFSDKHWIQILPAPLPCYVTLAKRELWSESHPPSLCLPLHRCSDTRSGPCVVGGEGEPADRWYCHGWSGLWVEHEEAPKVINVSYLSEA